MKRNLFPLQSNTTTTTTNNNGSVPGIYDLGCCRGVEKVWRVICRGLRFGCGLLVPRFLKLVSIEVYENYSQLTVLVFSPTPRNQSTARSPVGIPKGKTKTNPNKRIGTFSVPEIILPACDSV